MATSTIINKFGKMTGWNSLTLNLLGRDIEAFTELEYDDNVDLKNAYGGNKYPIGRGEGNYEAKCSITLYKEESDALQKSLPKGTRFSDIPPFNIGIEYETNDGFVQKDRINFAQIPGRGVKIKQGDGTTVYKYTLIVSTIDWNI